MPSVVTTTNTDIVQAQHDYDAVTEEELDFLAGDQFIVLNRDDPEWYFVRRIQGDDESILDAKELEGYIPKSYIKDAHMGNDELQPTKNHIPKQSSTTEQQCYLLDKGLCLSVLMLPKLTPLANNVEDIRPDPQDHTQLQLRPANCAFGASFIEALHIPSSISDNITGRELRVCLYDKARKQVLSNIQIIPVLHNTAQPMHWKAATTVPLLIIMWLVLMILVNNGTVAERCELVYCAHK